jgi:hypothetical protein
MLRLAFAMHVFGRSQVAWLKPVRTMPQPLATGMAQTRKFVLWVEAV